MYCTIPYKREDSISYLYRAPGFTIAIAAVKDLNAHSTKSEDFLSILPTKNVSFKSPWNPYRGRETVMEIGSETGTVRGRVRGRVKVRVRLRVKVRKSDDGNQIRGK